MSASVSTPPEALERLREELFAKGRAFIGVTIDLYDESGALTLSATVE